ncbi:threonine transporter RhtB [Niveispirillum lacus]|uniref:Threonine transporter RhtB n=1 Tax=Niveispirillum lacus TaxID=1981099 RepID=A0A255YY86_9PROT|nr:LysE family translocator [Niveispirillum lacus]OYQ34196.1 threonine transporter RhtB [Niveispirillum lacus]
MLFDVDLLAAFSLTALLLAYAPGPDNIFVLTQAALKGPWKGVMVTLGLCTGLIVHTTGVALGVAVVFQTSPTAFTLLAVVGALYLLYLAWGAWRAAPETLTDPTMDDRGEWGRLYLRGIIMNVTNPKVAIFFLAFLPQFTAPERGNLAMQLFILGTVFMLCALLAFSSIAFAAGSIRPWLRTSNRGQILLNRVAALVFVGLALTLLTAQQ